ncbi:polyketide synthase [Chloropicon primus]|uniref:Polyketide synthase n=2 Tax=Chloropicon primus TaxID=1764295 RepID=A0A5B8MSB9_9CHLO|nr:polyketide synthase [Chloropicon primus]|eukprot:QDZ22814.1 polyketide synthase [Chloropicon primus]
MLQALQVRSQQFCFDISVPSVPPNFAPVSMERLCTAQSLSSMMRTSCLEGNLSVHCIRMPDIYECSSDVSGGMDLIGKCPTETDVAGGEQYNFQSTAVSPFMFSRKFEWTPPPYHVHSAPRGLVSSLKIKRQQPVALHENAVEICVRSIGLNFRDLLNVLGLYPGPPGYDPGLCGGDAAGTVVNVNQHGGHPFCLGSSVFGFTPGGVGSGGLGSNAVTPSILLAPVPPACNFDHAAMLPTAFVANAVAWEAMLSRFDKIESILVHGASGGIGLAAIELSKLADVRVYGTCSTALKRTFVRSLSIQSVMDSRSTKFVSEIASQQSRCIQSVINFATNPGMVAGSLSLLERGGMFVELSKTNIWHPFCAPVDRQDISMNLVSVGAARADNMHYHSLPLVSICLQQLAVLLTEGKVKSSSHTSYKLKEVSSAFKTLLHSKFVGKAVICADRTLDDLRNLHGLIYGGQGALGVLFARWCIAQGMQKLLLGSQSGHTRSARAAAEMSHSESEVLFMKANIACQDNLCSSPLLQTETNELIVLHGAGILRDATVLQQRYDQVMSVFSPKCRGVQNASNTSWSLAVHTDIGFSSIAALLGSAGQIAYSAANAYLDSYMTSSHSFGKSSYSIQWGAWGNIGMARSMGMKERLLRLGMAPVHPMDGLFSFELLLQRCIIPISPVFAVAPITWKKFSKAVNFQPQLCRAAKEEESFEAIIEGERKSRQPQEEMVSSQTIRKMQEDVQNVVYSILGSQVPIDSPLVAAGIDSLGAVELRNSLENVLGVALPGTLVFDYPSISAIVSYMAPNTTVQVQAKEITRGATRKEYLHYIVDIASQLPYAREARKGTACDAISLVPVDRWDANEGHGSKLDYNFGGFMTDVHMFDYSAFSFTKSEAMATDPQQRLLLKLSASCLVDDSRKSCGSFVGIATHDHSALIQHFKLPLTPYIATGTGLSVAAGRLSYQFGLNGPALSIDTACSSSLVGVHMAYTNFLHGTMSSALCSGVNVMISKWVTGIFDAASLLSEEGRCKALDNTADGYVRAEACTCLRIVQSEEIVDNAVLFSGSSVNQDGRASSLTAPNGPSQKAVIAEAHIFADIDANDLMSIFLHGTGTALGDPIEITSLHDYFSRQSQESAIQPKIISADKSNIGHAEAAAGLAGFYLAQKSIFKKHSLPISHLRTLNRHISYMLDSIASDTSEFMLMPRETYSCPQNDNRTRSVGINSFAFQGTNAHIVCSEAQDQLHSSIEKKYSIWQESKESLNRGEFTCAVFQSFRYPSEGILLVEGENLKVSKVSEVVSELHGRKFLPCSTAITIVHEVLDAFLEYSTTALVTDCNFMELFAVGECNSKSIMKYATRCTISINATGKVILHLSNEHVHNLSLLDGHVSTPPTQLIHAENPRYGADIAFNCGPYFESYANIAKPYLSTPHAQIDSSLHLMDSVTSSSSDGFELQARIPASVEACILSTSSLGVSLHAVGSATEVGRVTQSSQIDASPCLVDKLSFRVISSKEDISIPTVGGVSSSRDILDACKLYNICWYAQTPVVSSDVLTASEPATQLHVEESAICPHHILAGMQDLVEKGTDALWMHSSGSLDTSASPAGLHKDHGASGYMSWAMLRSIALECTSVQCGGVDTSPLHPSASARGLQFSSKSYAMDVTVDVFGCSMDNGSLYLPQLTLQRDTTQTHAVMNSSHHLGKGRRHVVTGGLSGIGQMVGGWCVRSSLGSSLGLLGRTGKSRTCPEELRAGDMSVSMARCDVSVREEASWWMMERCDDLYPLGMVVHAAGVLLSASLKLQDISSLLTCMAPKVQFLNFVSEVLDGVALVTFSSLSSVFGNSGNVNYAAANAVVDLLSSRSFSMGSCVHAIQWGAIAGIGMMTKFEGRNSSTIEYISPVSCLAYLEQRMKSANIQSTVSASTRAYIETISKINESFQRLVGIEKSLKSQKQPQRLHNNATTGKEEVQRNIQTQINSIIGRDIEPNCTLMEAGLDSLGVVELRNTISSSVGVQLPSTVILDYPSINALTTFICGELGLQEGKSVQELHEVLPSAEMGVTRCVALNSFSALLPVATTMKPGAGIGDAITSVPFGRWDLERSEAMMPSGQLTARFAGLLKDVSTFDTACFGMSVTEASLCDPQQRLLLQVSWESMQSCVLNDAQDSSNIQRRREKMGVYVGIEHMEYNGLMKDHNMPLSPLMQQVVLSV